MARLLILFLSTVALFGQETTLERLKRTMAEARGQEARNEKESKFGDGGVARIAAIHYAFRDWLESELPASLVASAELESSLGKKLAAAGLAKPDSANTALDIEDPGFDSVGIELKTIAELPGILFVTASVKVPCGSDQAVYAYRFDSNGRAKIIEDHPQSDWGYGGATLRVSDPDASGRRLLLIDRWSVQCASSWMETTYAVYRLSSPPPESLLSARHGFWLGNDGPEFILKPDELIIELLGRSLDGGVHNRTHIFRYSLAGGIKRIEPLAFQPQDFAEEWLSSPWSEMRSRSAPDTQKWHAQLHDQYVSGDYTSVVPCTARADRWSIGFEVTHIGEKEFKEPLAIHLLVRDLGNYRFEMEAVSGSEFAVCPGSGEPSDKHPWLSVEQLKALP